MPAAGVASWVVFIDWLIANYFSLSPYTGMISFLDRDWSFDSLKVLWRFDSFNYGLCRFDLDFEADCLDECCSLFLRDVVE